MPSPQTFMSASRRATLPGVIRPWRQGSATDEGWGPPNEDSDGWFGSTIVRWYPTVQWLDGLGMADLLRSNSLYRELDEPVREQLLDAITNRIRTDFGNRMPRRYLSVLRAGRRADR